MVQLPLRHHVPNALTVSRLFVAALVVWCVQEGFGLAALFFYIAGAVTDGLDGYLAKRWRCQTKLGEFLDPSFDKLFCWVLKLGIFLPLPLLLSWDVPDHSWDWDYRILLPAALVIGTYDIGVIGYRIYAWRYGLEMKTGESAKTKTAVLCVGFGLIIAIHVWAYDTPLVWLSVPLFYFIAYQTVRSGLKYLGVKTDLPLLFPKKWEQFRYSSLIPKAFQAG